MIEYRAMLRKPLKFEGGFNLENGTIIYARETEYGWLGSYYEDKGCCHSFSLADDAFSILEAGDLRVAELVITPDPPEPPERAQKIRDMEHKRLLSRITRHREEADALEALVSNLRYEGSPGLQRENGHAEEGSSATDAPDSSSAYTSERDET